MDFHKRGWQTRGPLPPQVQSDCQARWVELRAVQDDDSGESIQQSSYSRGELRNATSVRGTLSSPTSQNGGDELAAFWLRPHEDPNLARSQVAGSDADLSGLRNA